LAALLVVFGHAYSVNSRLDPTYHVSGAWQYSAPGHLSVIVFFMLSGYVIGLSNPKPISTNAERRLYWRKRLVRLYPLYGLSIVVMVLVGLLYHHEYGLGKITSSLLFLQGLVYPVPYFNQPVWSLGYEMLYYGLFLVVSARGWRPARVALGFLLAALLVSHTSVVPVICASYCYGAVFWFLGLYLAAQPPTQRPMEYGTLLAFLLLLLCFERMNLAYSMALALQLDVLEADVPQFFNRAIVFSDLSSLVYCVPLLLCATNRTVRGKKWLERGAFVIPFLYLAAYVLSGKIHQQQLLDTLYVPLAFYVLALMAYVFRYQLGGWGEVVVQKLKPLGLISYGIYIIHFPLLFLVRYARLANGTFSAFILQLVLYFTFVLAVGWLLETKLQPWVKKQLI
jgi:peptidoglycan/LPS O-acetylase OafA/YrhL